MTHIVADRVYESFTTTGNGVITTSAAITGFQRFSAVCAVNDTFWYEAEAVDANGVPTGDWECGFGTYSAANQITRTTVNKSSFAGSPANSAISWAAGTKRIALCLTATQANKGPIRTIYTSGSGTHTTTVGCLYMEVEMVGAGAGGAGGGGGSPAPGKGTGGGNTTFGAGLTANGGAVNSTFKLAGAGGTATGGDINIPGDRGQDCLDGYTNTDGMMGGGTPFGGNRGSNGQTAGINAVANTGSGGGGAGSSGTASPGASGAAGGYLRKLITAPAATYAYAVGAKGTKGAAGATGGNAGGDGADGIIIVTEYFR